MEWKRVVNGAGGKWVVMSPSWQSPSPLLSASLVVVVVVTCCMPMTPTQATDLSGVVTAFTRDVRPPPQPCPSHCNCTTRRAHDLMQDYLSQYFLQPTLAFMEPQLEPKLRSTMEVMTSWLGSMDHVQCSLLHGTDRLSLNAVLQSSILSFKSIYVECHSGGSVVWDLPPLYAFINALHVSGCALETPVKEQKLVVPPNVWVLEFQRVPPEAVYSLDFSQASQLLMLSLTHSSLSYLPRRWFKHVLQSLWFISLAHNNLSTYECELKAPQIQAISLDYNSIAALPRCFLDGSKYSSHISLRHNQIHSLQELSITKSEAVKQVIPKMNYLDLSHNQVDSVRALKKIDSLLGLDLSYNHLDIMASDSLFLNPQLVWLDLSNNFLEHIGDALLNSLLSLEHLNLSHNYLRSFDFDHNVLSPELIILDLRHNRLIYPPFAALAYVAPPWVQMTAADNPYLCDCNVYPFLQQHIMMQSDIWSSIRSLYSFTVRAANGHPYVDMDEFTCAGPPRLKGVLLTTVDFQKVCPLPRGCPKDCKCNLVKEAEPYISVDCSEAQSMTELPEGLPFIADTHLVLFFNQTRIKRLDYRPYLHRVKELHAGQSKVSSLMPDALKALENISILDLHDSQIRSLPAITQYLSLPASAHLDLSGNPWACGCRDLWMPAWMARHNAVVTDTDQIRCYWTGKLVTQLSATDLNCGLLDYLPFIIAMSLITGVLLIMLSFLAKFKLEILVFIHRHSGLRPMDMFKYDETQPSLFDVFVSFSDADYMWVEDNLLARLEKRRYRTPYRLCTLRDFPPGIPLEDRVTWAAENTLCTLLVLTRNLLLNEWGNCPETFRTAHLRLLQECPNKLLVLIHGPLDARCLDPELRAHLRMGGRRAYLKSNEAWFWPKLEYALPRPQGVVFPILTSPLLEEEALTRSSSKAKRGRAGRGVGRRVGGEGPSLLESVGSAAAPEMDGSCQMPGSLAAGDVTPPKSPRPGREGGGSIAVPCC